MRKSILILIVLATFLLIGAILFSPSFSEKPSELLQKTKTRAEKIEELKKEKRKISFVFYGKVVDLDGNPVPEAKVDLRIRYSPLLPYTLGQKEIQLTTDDHGLFVLDENGFLLELDNIEKAGYEYRFQYNPKRSFRYRLNEKKAELGHFPDQPIVFKIRKRGKPTLVLHRKASQRLDPGSYPVFLDLLWQQWTYAKGLLYMPDDFKGWQPDVKIYLEGEQGNFQLAMEAIDDDTRLIVDKRELYEAPVSGYRPKVTIPFKHYERGAGLNTHVYVEGRGGQFFSRLHLSAGFRNYENPEEPFVVLNIDWLTNPNGEGNFEESNDLGRQYREEVRFGKRRPYGYDAKAKGLSMEEISKLLGK